MPVSEPFSGFSLGSIGRMVDGVISRVVQDLTNSPLPTANEWAVATEGFRSVREVTEDQLAHLTQEQADFRPSPGSWSIGQIAGHLLLSEKMYREQLQRLIELAREGRKTNVELSLRQVNSSIAYIPRDILPLFDTPLRVFNNFIPRAFREAMFRYPIVPASTPAISEPPVTAHIKTLRADLKTSLAATEALFAEPLPPNLSEMTLTHPLMGTNNPIQLLSLMGAHEERHQTQIRAVKSHAQYPRAAIL
jgi:uncharacterized damage-inducible protein DinB